MDAYSHYEGNTSVDLNDVSQPDEKTPGTDLESQSGTDKITSGTLDEEKEKAPADPNIVDWDGPNDPDNPMNWTSSKKVAAIGIVSLITLIS